MVLFCFCLSIVILSPLLIVGGAVVVREGSTVNVHNSTFELNHAKAFVINVFFLFEINLVFLMLLLLFSTKKGWSV
jgi:hypothetical protein